MLGVSMSNEEAEIWFFLRGQETVGPFSKKIIQQIHEGGQLALETMVWREGMDGSAVPVDRRPTARRFRYATAC